jgi:hypothetical protein
MVIGNGVTLYNALSAIGKQPVRRMVVEGGISPEAKAFGKAEGYADRAAVG